MIPGQTVCCQSDLSRFKDLRLIQDLSYAGFAFGAAKSRPSFRFNACLPERKRVFCSATSFREQINFPKGRRPKPKLKITNQPVRSSPLPLMQQKLVKLSTLISEVSCGLKMCLEAWVCSVVRGSRTESAKAHPHGYQIYCNVRYHTFLNTQNPSLQQILQLVCVSTKPTKSRRTLYDLGCVSFHQESLQSKEDSTTTQFTAVTTQRKHQLQPRAPAPRARWRS